MYYPTLSPQLTAIATASVDCGVRATKMGLDWLSKGEVIRSVKDIRRLGAMGDGPTNYQEWDEVIDTLGGRTLGFAGVKTHNWSDVAAHLRNYGAAIVAVDYGVYRRSMQAKSGSLTFNGYHGILFVNRRRRNDTDQTRSFDSLLDGRYRGCPKGPVWVPMWKVRKAAEEVGRKEVGNPVIYAVNLFRDSDVAPVDPGDVMAEEPPSTLIDTLTDLYQTSESLGPTAPDSLFDAIVDLEALIGVSRSQDDTDTEVAPGIRLSVK